MNIQQALYNFQKDIIHLLQCCHSYMMLNGLIDNKNALSLSIEFIILRDEWLKDDFGTIKHHFGNDNRFSFFLNVMGSDMNSIGSRDDSNDNESEAFVAQLMEAIDGFAPNEDLGPFNRFDPNTNDPPPNQATSPQRPTLQFNDHTSHDQPYSSQDTLSFQHPQGPYDERATLNGNGGSNVNEAMIRQMHQQHLDHNNPHLLIPNFNQGIQPQRPTLQLNRTSHLQSNLSQNISQYPQGPSDGKAASYGYGDAMMRPMH